MLSPQSLRGSPYPFTPPPKDWIFPRLWPPFLMYSFFIFLSSLSHFLIPSLCFLRSSPQLTFIPKSLSEFCSGAIQDKQKAKIKLHLIMEVIRIQARGREEEDGICSRDPATELRQESLTGASKCSGMKLVKNIDTGTTKSKRWTFLPLSQGIKDQDGGI